MTFWESLVLEKLTGAFPVLGLQSNRAARRLARLLVADVLGHEGAWEQQFTNLEDNDSRSFILR